MTRGFYTAAEAARISKVPRSTVDYWARTELIVPSQRAERPRLYSFEDLRDLVVAKKLRDQGAGVRDQRAALEYVREEHDIDRLAKANFAVYEGQLVHLPPGEDQPVAPHRKGQYLIRMQEVFHVLGVEDAQLKRLHPAARISIDPEVRGGTPVITGTRIPVALVAELVAEDVPRDEILALYPSLEQDDIDAAVDWTRESTETSSRRATG